MSSKTYYIETYGCQANESDSQKLSALLENLGFESAENYQNSDIFIINSCSVRQKSEDKVYGLARTLGKDDTGNSTSKPFTILTGCMVGSVKGERQRYSFSELQKRTPWVDLYLSPEETLLLPNFLVGAGVLSREDALISKEAPVISKKGYINISYGCDNFCSYCVVPYARGKEISRSQDEIFSEIEELLNKGITEITLLGQNVNSWGLSGDEKKKIRVGDESKLPFAQLLRDIHGIEQVSKISFLSSNPFDFSQDLVDTMGLPKIDNYLHIAVQSGNNDILTRMNRRHTVEEFIGLIDKIKKVKPNLELGTDIICLLYTSPSPRDRTRSRMPSSA